MIGTEQKQAVVRRWLGSGSLNLFGVPFAGKDKQSERLAQWLGAPVISGGDLLRRHDDLLPHIRQELIDGLLVQSDYFLKVVTPYLAREEFVGRPLILSSVGRFDGEQEHIMAAAQQSGHPIKAVVLLELDVETLWRRWHKAHDLMDRGDRLEDSEEAQEVRLNEFATKTRPVLEYYRRIGLLVTVDGRPSIDEVALAVLDALYERAMSVNVASAEPGRA